MKEIVLTVLISVLSFNCYAQTSFEKGYFIDNEGQKTNVLIKNLDWKDNPTEFQYKLSENDFPKTATINSVKEWGIADKLKYRRYTVNIDRSSEDIKRLSSLRNPVFNEEQLFLKALVEGKANLYAFEDGNLRRYFFKTHNSDIEQLVYKKYLTPNNTIGKNKEYKHQLWNTLKCKDFPITLIQDVDYRKNDLVKYFINYNECQNSEFTIYEKKQNNDIFHLTIRPGFRSSNLKIHNSINTNSWNANFGRELGLSFGVEAEVIMPFNNNKWAFLIEPTFQYFKSEKEISAETIKVDYKSIEVPIGIRHYFFLNNNSKLFINGLLVSDFSNNSNMIFERVIDSKKVAILDLDIKTRINPTAGLGAGYKYNNKLSFELRYIFKRDLLTKHKYLFSDYNSFSVMFGYTVF